MTFSPGDRVLWLHDLRYSWWVSELATTDGGSVRVFCDGRAAMTFPARDLVLAPPDWRDAPPPPADLTARHDVLLWDEARATEAARGYGELFVAWDREHRAPLLRLLEEDR